MCINKRDLWFFLFLSRPSLYLGFTILLSSYISVEALLSSSLELSVSSGEFLPLPWEAIWADVSCVLVTPTHGFLF